MRPQRPSSRLRVLGIALLCVLAAAAQSASAAAGERLPGPIGAQVLRVLDGDTLLVRAHIWLGQQIETRVRLAGIDAPELRSTCQGERDLAVRARVYVAAHLATADGGLAQVSLYDVGVGKFGGRVLARVLTADGKDLADVLLNAGLARAYRGTIRRSWCGGANE